VSDVKIKFLYINKMTTTFEFSKNQEISKLNEVIQVYENLINELSHSLKVSEEFNAKLRRDNLLLQRIIAELEYKS
jgi:hypothetical protein